jgi:hypothetical protein
MIEVQEQSKRRLTKREHRRKIKETKGEQERMRRKKDNPYAQIHRFQAIHFSCKYLGP